MEKRLTMDIQDKELLKEQYREMRVRNRSHHAGKVLKKEPNNEKFKSITYPKNQTE